MLDLRLLQNFIAVAEQMSFTKAANRLYISQPALSQQITELENQLGTALFVRNKRSIVLTAAGSALLDEGRELLKNASELEKRVHGSYSVSGNRPCFHIALGSDVYYSVSVRNRVMDALAQMREFFPDMGIKIEELSAADIDKEFSMGLDVAVAFANRYAPKKGIFHRPLENDRYVLLLPPDVDMDDLGNELRELEMYLPQGDTVIFNAAMAFVRRFELSPEILFESNVNVILCLLQSCIQGATIVPAQSLPMLSGAGFKVMELPDEPEFDCGVEVFWTDGDSVTASKFMELLKMSE